MLLTLLIPSHNEAGNIALLVHRVAEVLRGTGYEIIFIDDGSTDGTLYLNRGICIAPHNLSYIDTIHSVFVSLRDNVNRYCYKKSGGNPFAGLYMMATCNHFFLRHS